jgi:hypothetical protein
VVIQDCPFNARIDLRLHKKTALAEARAVRCISLHARPLRQSAVVGYIGRLTPHIHR